MYKIELTKEQIQALLVALANTTEYRDVLSSVFNNDLRSINCCIRAENKLRAALGFVQNKEWDEKYIEKW